MLAELCRRDLVPAVWVPPLEERAMREQLRRRMHLVRLRASAMNRIFGLLTQWGLRISFERLRAADAWSYSPSAVSTRRGAVGRRGARGNRLARRARRATRTRLRHAARDDERAAAQDDPRRRRPARPDLGERDRRRLPLPHASKLVGYAGLAPRVLQSGERSHTGALSKAGSRTLRWAAVEAANAAWRPTNPWHEHYSDIAKRAGNNPAKSAVARKILIACWHILNRQQPFKPARSPASGTNARQAPAAFWPPDGPAWN